MWLAQAGSVLHRRIVCRAALALVQAFKVNYFKGNSLATETTTPETDSSETPNPCRRELSVEVPAEVVKNETEKIIILRY